MKKPNIIGIVAAVLALAAGIVLVCIYMKELRSWLLGWWEKLEAKRSNLQVYMD